MLLVKLSFKLILIYLKNISGVTSPSYNGLITNPTSITNNRCLLTSTSNGINTFDTSPTFSSIDSWNANKINDSINNFISRSPSGSSTNSNVSPNSAINSSANLLNQTNPSSFIPNQVVNNSGTPCHFANNETNYWNPTITVSRSSYSFPHPNFNNYAAVAAAVFTQQNQPQLQSYYNNTPETNITKYINATSSNNISHLSANEIGTFNTESCINSSPGNNLSISALNTNLMNSTKSSNEESTKQPTNTEFRDYNENLVIGKNLANMSNNLMINTTNSNGLSIIDMNDSSNNDSGFADNNKSNNSDTSSCCSSPTNKSKNIGVTFNSNNRKNVWNN